MHNARKSSVTERFIGALKNKIYKYMNSASKKVYIDKLNDEVDKYNSSYHNTITIHAVDVKSSTYIFFNSKIAGGSI